MRWKFWKPRPRPTPSAWEEIARVASEENNLLRRESENLRSEIDGLRAINAAARRLAQTLAVDEPIVLGQLALVQESTQWWRCLLTILDEQTKNETAAALMPQLSSEHRHFNAGRAAALCDLKDTLLQLWRRAQQLKRQ